MSNHAEHRAAQLAAFRDARDAGIDCWLEILPPGPPWPCPTAAAQAGRRYGHNDLPEIPLAGCQREHGCACCYLIELPPEEPITPESAARTEREYEEALAKLPRRQAEAIRSAVSGILRGFGLKG